jgi:hypothetical protein
MKKLKLLVILTITALVLSCTKEARLNNKIDGLWNIISYSGAPLPVGTSMTTTYSKGTNGSGNYILKLTLNGDVTSEFGSYQLDKNTKITYTPTGQGNTPYSFTIENYSKSKLTLINENNVKTELRKVE